MLDFKQIVWFQVADACRCFRNLSLQRTISSQKSGTYKDLKLLLFKTLADRLLFDFPAGINGMVGSAKIGISSLTILWWVARMAGQSSGTAQSAITQILIPGIHIERF